MVAPSSQAFASERPSAVSARPPVAAVPARPAPAAELSAPSSESKPAASPEPPAPTPEPAAPTPEPPAPSFPPPAAMDEQRWLDAVNSVRASSPRLGTSLGFGRLVSFDGSELTLAFTKQSSFHRGFVAGSGRTQIEQLLCAHLGRPVKLRVEEGSSNIAAPLSPAEREAEEKDARSREIHARVRSHAAVEASLRLLGGEIEQIQLLDVERPTPPQDSPDETS